jgi:hypothetical protein
VRDSERQGVDDAFKVIESWDKKVNKVRGVFNSLLHPSIMRMINDLFPDDLAGAWKYLINDLYLSELEEIVPTIMQSLLEIYTIKPSQTLAGLSNWFSTLVQPFVASSFGLVMRKSAF